MLSRAAEQSSGAATKRRPTAAGSTAAQLPQQQHSYSRYSYSSHLENAKTFGCIDLFQYPTYRNNNDFLIRACCVYAIYNPNTTRV
jgi:hypothetical protein